jgi:hypothetical protein
VAHHPAAETIRAVAHARAGRVVHGVHIRAAPRLLRPADHRGHVAGEHHHPPGRQVRQLRRGEHRHPPHAARGDTSVHVGGPDRLVALPGQGRPVGQVIAVGGAAEQQPRPGVVDVARDYRNRSCVQHSCWSDLEPEVGIEPTTYRLQDASSASSMASTCDYAHRVDLTVEVVQHRTTLVRATWRATEQPTSDE